MQAVLESGTELPPFLQAHTAESRLGGLEFINEKGAIHFWEDEIWLSMDTVHDGNPDYTDSVPVQMTGTGFHFRGAAPDLGGCRECGLYDAMQEMRACISFTVTWMNSLLKKDLSGMSIEDRLAKMGQDSSLLKNMYELPWEYIQDVARSGVPLWIEDALGNMHHSKDAEDAIKSMHNGCTICVDAADWHLWMAELQKNAGAIPVDKKYVNALIDMHVPVYRMDTETPERYTDREHVPDGIPFMIWPADLEYGLWMDRGEDYFASALDIMDPERGKEDPCLCPLCGGMKCPSMEEECQER
jgi:hypothetical protein